jgi:hypothetical protein
MQNVIRPKLLGRHAVWRLDAKVAEFCAVGAGCCRRVSVNA